jgi:thiol-disulfide isomerase/thioredoxin
MLAAGRLVAAPHPQAPGPLDATRDTPAGAGHGLIARADRPAAPPFALKDASGAPVSLAHYRGRVTLVNFWATWCPPCVHEIPSMNRLAQGYAAEEFAIVSINFKEPVAHMREFLRRVAVDFPVLMDADGVAARDWGVFAFPTSFLLDRDGRIRYSVNSAIDWDAPEVRARVDALVARPLSAGAD